jgi:hypothetical protein
LKKILRFLKNNSVRINDREGLMSTILLVILGTAQAWEAKTNASGEELHWADSNVHFSVNTSGSHGLSESEVREAISDSATSWNIGNLTFTNDGDTKNKGADYSDEIHSISFSDNWTEDPQVLALTYTWSTNDGNIVHFDMEINSEHHSWGTEGSANEYDLQNAITHEFGHAIGLNHSEEENATMAPSAVVGEMEKRDLHSDDVDGYTHLYSEANNGGGEEEVEEGNSGSSGSGGGAGTGTKNPNSGTYMVPLEGSGCSSASMDGYGWMTILLGMTLVSRRRLI